MEYVKLNNGIEIPMLGFGVFQVEDGAECVNAVRNALDVGYRHIDTAQNYGNEKSVGQAIKESGIPREEIFVTTKLLNAVQMLGVVADGFEESLDDLGMDYVDLYLMHWPLKPKKYMDAWLEMEKIYKSGRAKAIGVCNFHEHHLAEIEKVWGVVPALNQVELHPEFSQKPLIEYCKAKGIAMQSYSPLGGSRNAARMLQNSILTEIGKKYGKTAAQVILRWNIQQGIITIPRSIKPERIKSNFEVFDFELTVEDMAAIDAINIDARVGSNPDTFEFKHWINGGEGLEEIHKIRRIVFIEEQNVSEEDEMIAWEDETSEHLLMYEADVPVATGRIVMHDGKYSIGRVAVLKEHRGKGYGRVVMNDLINRAYRLGAKEIEIHAQSYLVNFYSSFGFEICSEEYEEAGIMHFTMILKK